MLSSGKTQASYEALGLQEERGSNIWYNPIPEEEDAGGPHRDNCVRDPTGEGGASWRVGSGETRAELGGVWVRSEESFISDCPREGTNPSVSHHIDDITAENTGEVHT